MEKTKNTYTELQRAMIYGSYIALRDENKVVNLYLTKFNWNLHRTTVIRICNKFEITHAFEDFKRTGQEKKITDMEIDLAVETLTKTQNMNSIADAKEKIHQNYGKKYCDKTIRRYVKEEGLKYLKMPMIKNLTIKQIEKRNEYRQFLLSIDPNELIFCDESPYYLQRKNIILKSWMKPNDIKSRKIINPNRCIQIFGAISMLGKSQLYILPQKKTWTTETYEESVTKVIVPFLDKFYPKSKPYYIQDNARPHISNNTKDFLSKLNMVVIQQSANSPDYNPIEKIWGIHKERVYRQGDFFNIKDLQNEIITQWDKIDQNLVRSTINHVLNNLNE